MLIGPVNKVGNSSQGYHYLDLLVVNQHHILNPLIGQVVVDLKYSSILYAFSHPLQGAQG